MKSKLISPAIAASMLLGMASANADSPYGNWKRPNGSTAEVWQCGGKMCGKVVAGKQSGFNMFLGGISPAGKDTWKGDMKHPKMGTSMTFNGTVKLASGKLNVKGCMIGGIFCDSEVWTK